ncbi:hypothetical protein E2C01_024147 [Portunus trituberculatus]|uniref:Uncharacterized protein n=1 Tax=Portunus trituberculatus TaxID=210409 RepID=A0A5B7EBY3_PORTR|nr:hypothetical protein [Portunus trituberculatus]
MEHSRRNKTAPPKVSLAMMQRFDPTLRSGFHFPAVPLHQPACLTGASPRWQGPDAVPNMVLSLRQVML